MFHGRECFMGPNGSWARMFHGREYFMGANILMCADILHVSKHFGYAQIFQDVRIYLIGSQYFDMRRYFEGVRIHFLEANIFVCKVIF